MSISCFAGPSLSQLLTLIRPPFDIRHRIKWSNAHRIDIRMSFTVTLLNVREVSRFLESWNIPREVLQVSVHSQRLSFQAEHMEQ